MTRRPTPRPLRLEALGKDSIPALKKGLASEHELVRFSSAEALAYLGSTSGAEDLAQLAVQYPRLASHCLLALASLDEPVCRTKLAELLRGDDPTLRCGAFLALRLVDEHDPRLHGERLNHAFWLHQIPATASPLASRLGSDTADRLSQVSCQHGKRQSIRLIEGTPAFWNGVWSS